MFLGLRTIVYPAPDLDASRTWWTQVLGVPPYFDEPFYVGFNPGGYELGLDPAGDPTLGARTYWGVRDVEAAAARLIALGAVVVEPITEPGEGIKLGMFRNPAGRPDRVDREPGLRGAAGCRRRWWRHRALTASTA